VEVLDREVQEQEEEEEGSGPGPPLEDCWDTCSATGTPATGGTTGAGADTTEAGGDGEEDITEDGEEDTPATLGQGERPLLRPVGPGQPRASEERGGDNSWNGLYML